MNALTIGTCFEKTFLVTDEDTAKAQGSGGEAVLATPRLVAWMENTAFEGIEANMTEEATTVGTFIEIKHMAASPVGLEVRVKATLVSQENRALNFDIDAWDSVEKIGEAIHQRFIVDKNRFNEKVQKKIESSPREEK